MCRKIQYSYQIGQEVLTVHASAGGHRSSQDNEKRRVIMVECDWEACGLITHRFRIAKMFKLQCSPGQRKLWFLWNGNFSNRLDKDGIRSRCSARDQLGPV